MFAPDILNKFSDLKFELLGESESKLMLLVCDDQALRAELEKRLEADLRDAGKNMVIVEPGEDINGLLQLFYSIVFSKRDVLSLVGLNKFRPESADRVLKQLNFHRDALIALKLPILIWLTSDLLLRFPGLAPDFWSRRTAVYRFTHRPTAELLGRLFTSENLDLTAPQTEARRAIDQIRRSERALSKCLRTEGFKVEKADAIIAEIQDNIAVLRNEARNGNPIDVALYLWNLSNLDEILEYIAKEYSDIEERVAEYVYTDRNEALLFAAQRLADILEKYLEEIPNRVRRKYRPNLVGTFQRFAVNRLAEIATDLRTLVGVSPDQLEHILYESEYQQEVTAREISKEDDFSGSEGIQPRSTLERAVSAQACYDLESWLTGYNEKRPAIFSEREGLVLKFLYSEEHPLSEFAKQLHISVRDLRSEIRQLEQKVRLFLSTAETRDKKPITKLTAASNNPQNPLL